MFHFVYIIICIYDDLKSSCWQFRLKKNKIIIYVQVYWFCHFWLFLMRSNIYLSKKYNYIRINTFFFLKNCQELKPIKFFGTHWFINVIFLILSSHLQCNVVCIINVLHCYSNESVQRVFKDKTVKNICAQM